MVFRDEPIKIGNPIYIVRFNSHNGLSPFKYRKWYYTAKSIEDENGIYGVSLDDMLTNGFYEMEFQRPENDVILLETSEEYLVSSRRQIMNIDKDVYEKLHVTEEEKPKWALLERLLGGRIVQETEFIKANILYITKGDDVGRLKEIFTNFISTGIGNPDESILTIDKSPFHYSSKEIASEIDFELIKQFAIKGAWMKSNLHGLEHWENVERNGVILAQSTGANVRVVRLFAYFHDLCRISDGYDSNHGERVIPILGHARDTLLTGLTDTEFEQLCFACSRHTFGSMSKDVTINTCFDADRLDLTRLGIKPNPERMATEIGAYYAANIDKFNESIELWDKK